MAEAGAVVSPVGDHLSRRLSPSRWAWVSLACVFATLGLAIKLEAGRFSTLNIATDAIGGLALIATGAWALHNPRDRRLGYVLLLCGGAHFAENLFIIQSTAFKLAGELLSAASLAPLVYLALTFPDSRLPERASRMTFGLACFVGYGLAPLKEVLIGDASLECGRFCNWRVAVDQTVHDALGLALSVAGATLGAVVFALLLRRYVHASPPLRSYIAPWMSCAVAIATVGTVDQVLRITVSDISRDWIVGTENVLTAAFALGFPVGLLRVRLRRAAAARMVVDLSSLRPGESPRDVLARALGDPDVGLILFDDGPSKVETPPGRVATPLVAQGRAIGVLVHDETLIEAAELVPAAATALALRLDNERLREAQSALAEVASEERRRLERDLHDGAQQRMVALAMELAQLRDDLTEDPELDARVSRVEDGLQAAIRELRSLARGMRPRALEDGGLGAAARSLAAQTPMAVSVQDALPERLPEHVETAAWFVVCEALTNAGKHARPRRVDISLALEDQTLVCTVQDDGCGGATASAGGGLAGLAARLATLGGALRVESPTGRGTRVTARLPLA